MDTPSEAHRVRILRAAVVAGCMLLSLLPSPASGKVPRKLMHDCGYSSYGEGDYASELAAKCLDDIDRLWRRAKPFERGIAVDDAAEQCSEGIARGCILVRDAAWLGYGRRFDPAEANYWTTTCERVVRDAKHHELRQPPHGSCRATGAEIEASAPKGWKKPKKADDRIRMGRELAAAGNLHGAWLWLDDAERGGLVPPRTTFATLRPFYPEDATEVTLACTSVFATDETCERALDTAWRDPARRSELAQVLSVSESRCERSAPSCRRARDAAWLGYGTALDPVRSASWAAKCGKAPCPVSGEEIEAAAPESWQRPDGPARIEAARALGKRGDAKGMVIYLADAAKRGLVPAGTAFDELVAPYAQREPSVVADVVTRMNTALPGLLPADRVEAARRAARDRHAGLAARASAAHAAYAARFHAAMAARFGAPATAAPLDLDMVLDALPLRPRLVLPPACENLRKGAEYVVDRFKRGTPVDVSLKATCRRDERRWSTDESYTYVVTETRYRTKVIPGTSRYVGYDCSYTQTTCDSNGHCWDSLQVRTCGSTETTPAQEVSEAYQVDVPKKGTRRVDHRELVLDVRGELRYGDRAPVPVGITRSLAEEQYTGPDGSKAFTSTDLAGLSSQAGDELGHAIGRMVDEVRREAAEREAVEARGATDPVLAEEHELRAYALGGPAAPLLSRYALEANELQGLFTAAK